QIRNPDESWLATGFKLRNRGSLIPHNKLNHSSEGGISMSEVKLNLVDAGNILVGTVHGSLADRCVAALSAEPETLSELASALARYNRPLDERGPFTAFQSSPEIDSNPWDAGLLVIDLASRIVLNDSTYSAPGPEGEVDYHDGTQATECSIPYRLPDD